MTTKTDTLGTIWHAPDALWVLIAPILEPDKKPGSVGRPLTPARLLFDAIIYVLRSGIQWQAIPREEYAPGSTVPGPLHPLGERGGLSPGLANDAGVL